jgi:hypothetical protein
MKVGAGLPSGSLSAEPAPEWPLLRLWVKHYR